MGCAAARQGLLATKAERTCDEGCSAIGLSMLATGTFGFERLVFGGLSLGGGDPNGIGVKGGFRYFGNVLANELGISGPRGRREERVSGPNPHGFVGRNFQDLIQISAPLVFQALNGAGRFHTTPLKNLIKPLVVC